MLTPEELRQIRRLHVQLGRRVDSPFTGEYRSAFRGRGMEFEEVRPYVPGDDVRHIDWNVTARANAPFIKEFREERELTLMLALDVSASMLFGAGGADGRTDKRLQVARLAGALAFAAIRNNDRVGLMSFSNAVERFLPPRKSRGHAWAVIRAAFEDVGQGARTDLAGALERLGRSLKRRSVVCVLSDFITPDDRYLRELGALARRHTVNCFLLSDPLEEALPPVGLIELEDAETGARRLVDASAVRPRVAIAERILALRRAGARASIVHTNIDPILTLHRHFQRMERRR
ncbi:MAG: DUF58 domain-containing protein [Myxococcota bacterium]